jgi:hypothetical protein
VCRADKRMRKRLPPAAIRIILELNTAEKVVKRIVVFCAYRHRAGRIRKDLCKALTLIVGREIALYAPPAAEIVNTAHFKTVEVGAISKEVVYRASAIDTGIDLTVRITDKDLTFFYVRRLAEHKDRGQQTKPEGQKKSFHFLRTPPIDLFNALKKQRPDKSENCSICQAVSANYAAGSRFVMWLDN